MVLVGCKRCSTPKSNTEYWHKKFKMNTDRDKKIKKELHYLGWHVIIIWEYEVKNETNLKKLIKKIRMINA